MRIVPKTWQADANTQTQIEALATHMLMTARQFAKQIYKTLEEAYDDLTSDACILETLQANGYQFNVYGNVI